LTKEIKAYLLSVTTFLAEEHTDAERLKFANDMHTRICFYQHERLIHFIVTALFAVLALMLFISASAEYFEYLMLAVSFLVLLIPYVFHYYFLENSVQKLYQLYYKLRETMKE